MWIIHIIFFYSLFYILSQPENRRLIFDLFRPSEVEDVNTENHCMSIATLVDLLKLELELADNLHAYADQWQLKVNIMNKMRDDLNAKYEQIKHDPEAYLGNPVNSFALIRRLHWDWHKWNSYIARMAGQAEIILKPEVSSRMPKYADLKDAVVGIDRLQSVYNLSAQDISKGLLNGKQYDVIMTPLDSFIIGFELLKMGKLNEGNVWLQNIVHDYKDNEINEILELTTGKVVQLYVESCIKLNRFDDAREIVKKYLKQTPNDEHMLSLKRLIEWKEDTATNEEPLQLNTTSYSYLSMCQGHTKSNLSRLHCRYNSENSAFSKLAPFKMEEVLLDPYMVIYYDVIYEREIVELKELATPQLTRAMLQNNIYSDRRTSKIAWLPNDLNNLTERINKRIEDMTGFDLSGSEQFQMLNYGLGGHYTLHKDAFEEVDRIVTLLFYLNNVDQGGATVFPDLNITMFPKNRAAIMWYNLENNLDIDYRVSHAACPVLVGSKWVFTKWIRSKDQLLKRPCYKK